VEDFVDSSLPPVTPLFIPPQPPDIPTQTSTPSTQSNFTTSTLEDKSEPREDLIYNKMQQNSDYLSGISILKDLMANYVNKQDGKLLSFSVPDICKESIAKLMNVLATCPFLPTNNDQQSEAEARPESIQNLLWKIKRMREQDGLLMNDSSSHQAPSDYHQNFVVGSYLGPDQQRVNEGSRKCKLTVEELQVFNELMTPDDNFLLYEDEQQLVNLYCELIRSELCALKNDAELKKKIQNSLKINDEIDDVDESRKIVDVFPILVKPEERHLYPADILMNQDDFVKLIMV
jgi:hypothetical protein